MTVYEEAIVKSRVETAENRIRAIHNERESQKIFGKKNYLSYDSKNFINMINLFRNKFKDISI